MTKKPQQQPKQYVGGRKNVVGEKQAEASTAQDQNKKHKANFKAGPFARTNPNAGREKPLIPNHQVAVKGKPTAAEETNE